MSLMDTFENDNEAFKALIIHFVQNQIDYDCSIISLIVSILCSILYSFINYKVVNQ